jgi:chemotaxis protein CheX
MLHIPLTTGQPMLDAEESVTFEISSIGMITGKVSGCVVINLSREMGLHLASTLLHSNIETIEQDALDAIGEITNMVIGLADTHFPIEEIHCGIPIVVVGKEEKIYPINVPVITVPCHTALGGFNMEIVLKHNL